MVTEDHQDLWEKLENKESQEKLVFQATLVYPDLLDLLDPLV